MELKLVLESILFSSQKPLSIAELRACIKEAPGYAEEPIPTELQQVKAAVLEQTLEDLSRDINVMGRSFRLTCVAGSWQFVNAPEYVAWIKALVGHRPRAPRLTQAALETLAIIAYRQPLTRAEAEQIRGESVVLKMLIDRGLVEQAGRAEVLGRPMTFKTTELFLEYFGLKNLEDLPAADDLRRVPVDKPPGLNTSDPELDTAETSDSEADTVEESSDNDPEAENDASDPNDVDKAFDADDAKDSGEDEEDEDWESDDLKEYDESSAGDGFDDDAELENDPSRN